MALYKTKDNILQPGYEATYKCPVTGDLLDWSLQSDNRSFYAESGGYAYICKIGPKGKEVIITRQ